VYVGAAPAEARLDIRPDILTVLQSLVASVAVTVAVEGRLGEGSYTAASHHKVSNAPLSPPSL
jgi:hypothetical protein